MKKHKTLGNNELMERLSDEVNEALNVRYLSLSLHLYIEYYLNELIKLKFDDAKFIIDEKELGSFYNKCLILRALRVFKPDDIFIRNIKIITKIRNFYAHHLLISDELPEENKSRIKQLVYLDREGNKSDYGVRWEECQDEYKDRLHVCGVSTISVLQKMVFDLEGIEISKP